MDHRHRRAYRHARHRQHHRRDTLAQPDPIAPPTIESTGVTGFSVSLTGTGPTLSPRITFSMNQTLRPGVTLELQASCDLGEKGSVCKI